MVHVALRALTSAVSSVGSQPVAGQGVPEVTRWRGRGRRGRYGRPCGRGSEASAAGDSPPLVAEEVTEMFAADGEERLPRLWGQELRPAEASVERSSKSLWAASETVASALAREI